MFLKIWRFGLKVLEFFLFFFVIFNFFVEIHIHSSRYQFKPLFPYITAPIPSFYI
ncbi:uncharacterized protein MELLADRAFT_91996 [Melampsora larici-populina 98AG31]|uniref:Uncharacterized protein n=1 Tax=Melampsora larici-populina (strain 98AG31 / pathotype 3-4-7) TaxID=747676 RepID=F4S158_MELLP|nr:uncharacterized protein MELLADRAFT_91996 [Melampsora larici-populina 98AG31]EGG01624.1 hypothetical protein MELLADRAFT_91996 [Melampsora larici-populina 98AG31]